MNGCIYRTRDGKCNLYSEGGSYSDLGNCKGRKMSNADRIRAMTDKELAAFIAYYDSNTPFCERMATRRWLEWLKREADNG